MKNYGKLLLSAYLIKKINSGKSRENEGIITKYGKLFLGAYVLKKLKSEKSQKEVVTEELELNKSGEGSAMKKLSKIIAWTLVGATAFYAFKKYTAKKSGYKISVE